MTFQGVCGLSGLLAARTWFFIPQGSIKDYFETRVQNDIVGLMELYKAITRCAHKVMQDLGQLTIQEFNDQFLYEIYKDRLFMVYHNMRDALRENTKIIFNSYDADGDCLEYDPNLHPLHSFQILVSDIKNEDFSILGGLCFGESFLISNRKVINLTEDVKTFKLWEKTVAKPGQSHLGDRLSVFENVQLLTENWGVFDGSLVVYENGWGFRSIQVGEIEYELSNFKSIEQHSSDLISFITENTQLVLKVSTRASGFLMSVWNIEAVDTPGPEFCLSSKSSITQSENNEKIPKNNGKTQLYLVIGLPGSGKTKAGEELARSVKGTLIKPLLRESVHLNKEF